MVTTPPPPLRCPACGAPVAEDQSWCLECGSPARTRIAPTPPWRAATTAIVVAVLLALTAIGFGVAELISNSGSASKSSTTKAVVVAPVVTTPALTPTNSTVAPPATGSAGGPTSATGPTGPTAATSGTGGATSATGATR